MLYTTSSAYSISSTASAHSAPIGPTRRAVAGMPRIVSSTATAPPTRPFTPNNHTRRITNTADAFRDVPQVGGVSREEDKEGGVAVSNQAGPPPPYASHAHDPGLDHTWYSSSASSPPSLSAAAVQLNNNNNSSYNHSSGGSNGSAATSVLHMGGTPPPHSGIAYTSTHHTTNSTIMTTIPTTGNCTSTCTPLSSAHRKAALAAPCDVVTPYHARRVYASPISSPLQTTMYAPAELYGMSESRENTCSLPFSTTVLHNSWTSMNDGVHEVSPIRVVAPASTSALMPNGPSTPAPPLLHTPHSAYVPLRSAHTSPRQTVTCAGTVSEPAVVKRNGVHSAAEQTCPTPTMTSSPQWVQKVIHCFDIHLVQDPTTHILPAHMQQQRKEDEREEEEKNAVHDVRAESVMADEYVSTREVSVREEKAALQVSEPLIVAVSSTSTRSTAPALATSVRPTQTHNTRHVESRSALHRGARRRRSARPTADSPSPTSGQDERESEANTRGGVVPEEYATAAGMTTEHIAIPTRYVHVVAEAAMRYVMPLTTHKMAVVVAPLLRTTCEQRCSETVRIVCNNNNNNHDGISTVPADYITPPRKTTREAHTAAHADLDGDSHTPHDGGAECNGSVSEERVSSHSPRRSLSVQSGELQQLLSSVARSSQEREEHGPPNWLLEEEPQSPPPCALAGFAEASSAHVKTKPLMRTSAP